MTLKHISEMLNDIFGELLWKGLIEDNPRCGNTITFHLKRFTQF